MRVFLRSAAGLMAAAFLCQSSIIVAQTPKIVRSAQGGSWSDAATWEGGKIPETGTKVLVREGHAVVYDVKSAVVLRSLHIAGMLVFATDKDTELNVGLIKIQHGESTDEAGFDCAVHPKENEAARSLAAPAVQSVLLSAPCLCCDGKPTLLVGTSEQPIAAGKTAKIRLHYIDGMDKESCPAIVNCGGRMDLHGQPMNRTWVKLGAPINGRSKPTEIALAEPVTGWRVGDQVIVTTTDRYSKTEGTRTIKAIEGNRLTIDQPLSYSYIAEGDLRADVANLSRNVIIESADPEGVRGHTMYHKKSAGSISYAEFRHLGKEGVLGRYNLHFHLCGDTMRGSSIVGASFHHSKNRWLTVHGTNYLVVRDCVGYESIGHGFFLEDGTEVYNVFDRNLATMVRQGEPLPKQLLPFDNNAGAGFWWANSLNTWTRNVACNNFRYDYRFEATPKAGVAVTFKGKGKKPGSIFGSPKDSFSLVMPVRQPDGSKKDVDIRTLPFVRFEDNMAHNTDDANGGQGDGWGLNMGEHAGMVGPDADNPFVIRNMLIWKSGKGFGVEVPHVLIDGMRIHGSNYGVWAPKYKAQDYRNVVFTGYPQYGGLDRVSTFDEWKQTGPQARLRLPGYTPRGVRDGGSEPAKPPESEVAKLNPIDTLPPITVITHVRKEGSQLFVRGTTSDNGSLKRVAVNGKDAKTSPQGEWEITLDNMKPGAFKLSALAEDAVGNIEKTAHELTVVIR